MLKMDALPRKNHVCISFFKKYNLQNKNLELNCCPYKMNKRHQATWLYRFKSIRTFAVVCRNYINELKRSVSLRARDDEKFKCLSITDNDSSFL